MSEELLIDFMKVFDSIHRESLWKIIKSYGIPDKLTKMVQLMYEDFERTVLEKREHTRWFKITKGIKQVRNNGGGSEDIKNRLNKARGAFYYLMKIWRAKNIGRNTKIKLFKTLMYAQCCSMVVKHGKL